MTAPGDTIGEFKADRDYSLQGPREVESDDGQLESDDEQDEFDDEQDESDDEQVESDDEKLDSDSEQVESDDEQLDSDSAQHESDDEQLESAEGQVESDEEQVDTDDQDRSENDTDIVANDTDEDGDIDAREDNLPHRRFARKTSVSSETAATSVAGTRKRNKKDKDLPYALVNDAARARGYPSVLDWRHPPFDENGNPIDINFPEPPQTYVELRNGNYTNHNTKPIIFRQLKNKVACLGDAAFTHGNNGTVTRGGKYRFEADLTTEHAKILAVRFACSTNAVSGLLTGSLASAGYAHLLEVPRHVAEIPQTSCPSMPPLIAGQNLTVLQDLLTKLQTSMASVEPLQATVNDVATKVTDAMAILKTLDANIRIIQDNTKTANTTKKSANTTKKTTGSAKKSDAVKRTDAVKKTVNTAKKTTAITKETTGIEVAKKLVDLLEKERAEKTKDSAEKPRNLAKKSSKPFKSASRVEESGSDTQNAAKVVKVVDRPTKRRHDAGAGAPEPKRRRTEDKTDDTTRGSVKQSGKQRR
ncbi:hypothetical protein NLG97_g3814 [Lecanicillium saksenae]|uniref:Uncharacterized protein n=1 Tax=Lecanicillium saksenae TaxID=468837 RepID=A0ACC1QZQ6_9HYPO|nr:hypothetical protein NLG97_g3814 [Lecanicillium saksenae]